MCTFLLSKRFKFTFKPITVYKVLRYWSAGYYTPIMRCSIKLGNIYRARGRCRIDFYEFGPHIGQYIVCKGVIHSFTSKASCIEYCDGLDNAVIVKCEIPRFTFYALGESAFREKEAYVSKRLKYLHSVTFV